MTLFIALVWLALALALAVVLPPVAASAAAAARAAPMRIEWSVDAQTADPAGRAAGAAHDRTSGYVSYYSDSAGVVAFDELGLLGRSVNADQRDCGDARACAQPGVLLPTRPGARATVYLNRTQPAELVYCSG